MVLKKDRMKVKIQKVQSTMLCDRMTIVETKGDSKIAKINKQKRPKIAKKKLHEKEYDARNLLCMQFGIFDACARSHSL